MLVKRHIGKKHRIIERPCRNQSPSPSGTSSDEPSSSMVSDEVDYAQKSALHHLLMALGSGKESLATAYKRRKREGGEIDSDEQEHDESESSSASYKEDLSGDSDSMNSSGGAEAEENESSKHGAADTTRQRNDIELEDVAETSDSDDESNLENGEKETASDLQSRSHFHNHLAHTLTKSEVDDLLKTDWKYKWKMPAFDSSTSKWKGTGECFLEEDRSNLYGLKMKLYKQWMDCYMKSGGSDFNSSRQRHFFSLCNSYRDIVHCAKKGFYMKGVDEDLAVMDAYIMHSLNHVYKTRALVTKNDAKLARNQDRNETKMLHGDGFLDRGFTRPKVLLLLPFRSIAFRVVKRLIQLTPPSHKTNVEYFDRFLREFGNASDEKGHMEELGNDALYDENLKSEGHAKPADFQVLFGGNVSEEFMIGIKFTRGSIKLYSDFHSSDIIMASPVQLVHAIGKAEAEKDKDVDYLSSIEVLVIDHADIIAMQNWSHVNSILEQLNEIPSDQHGSDVMRARAWYLDGHARFYRQTILLGSFLNADMNASFNNLCLNYEGKVSFASAYKGILAKVLLPVRQVFERFDALIADADDSRFNYFVKKVFPKIKDSIQGGIMIFISCYFDFVRIRNFLKSQNASFCLLGEYTKQSDISRARGWFFKGQRKIMLYTERAHFYHRYKIRGIQNLIFYSLPERKEFYPEITNMLDGAKNMSCSVLFSHFDNLQDLGKVVIGYYIIVLFLSYIFPRMLGRIVGSASSKRMLSSDKGIFVFC